VDNKPQKPRQKTVVLFTSPTCKWCSVAKNYFKSNDIKFKAIDITKDKKAEYDCLAHGCRGVPVIMIGSQWICGFDEKKIKRALG